MDNLRPQLSLAELSQLRWFLGGFIGLLSAWTLFYMEVDALLALAFLTLTVPVFTFWPNLSRALPAFIHRLAFPLIVTIFALDLWANREPLPAMIRLDLMLLGYRCIAPRGRREDLQLILLSLFVVVVTGVFTVSPAFVVQILFFTAASLGLLLAITLSDARSSGAPAAATANWERVRWRDLFARVRAVTDLRIVGFGAVLFGGLVVLSAVLFLAMPRVEISNSFFLDKLITKKSRTGFSDNVRFNEVVDISEDKSEAFEVDVSDPETVPADLYWRMVVLDEYSGDGFKMSPGLQNTLLPSREKLHTHNARGLQHPIDDTRVWTIFYQPGVSRYLPLMGVFNRLSFGEPQAVMQSRAMRLAALQTEPSKMVGYRVEGMDTTGVIQDESFARHKKVGPPRYRRAPLPVEHGLDENGDPILVMDEMGSPPREVTFLELDSLDENSRAMLDQWVVEIGGAGEGGSDFARRAGAWLQSRHSYSMQSRLPPGEGDRLTRWIASNEPGHCELFAGSIVLLARGAGLPSRLVTGFKGGSWNEAGRFISVKNSDAHAWTEIWEESLRAWIRVDATPGAQITPASISGASPEMLSGVAAMERDSGWGARLDSFRVFWYRRIVNFDQNSQLDLLRSTKEQLRMLMESVRVALTERAREFSEWLRQPWDFPRVAAIALLVGLGSGLVVLWHKAGRAWWLAWRSRRASSHAQDPVRREASLWLARLEKCETEWRPGAVQARQLVGTARAQLLRLRYGAREGWASPTEVFRLARRARRAARKSAG